MYESIRRLDVPARRPLFLIAAVLVAVTSSSALAAGSQHPVGLPGHWRMVFDDEFNGTSLHQTVWNAHNGWTNQNNVTDHWRNITVHDGDAIFRLASMTSGAEMGTRHFRLRVSEYAEARISFAGDGSTIYNWPAWWVSGPDWPNPGENDIAEGLGELTVQLSLALGQWFSYLRDRSRPLLLPHLLGRQAGAHLPHPTMAGLRCCC